MNDGIVALNNNWLNDTQTVANVDLTTTGGSLAGQTFYPSSSNFFYQQYYPWVERVYVNSQSRPIKLTLGEVDALRKAAKADDKLRTILAKFTDQIEVIVDFGKSGA